MPNTSPESFDAVAGPALSARKGAVDKPGDTGWPVQRGDDARQRRPGSQAKLDPAGDDPCRTICSGPRMKASWGSRKVRVEQPLGAAAPPMENRGC